MLRAEVCCQNRFERHNLTLSTYSDRHLSNMSNSSLPMGIEFPKMVRLQQRFSSPVIADPATKTYEQMQVARIGESVKPGQSVAIAVGSRGIANLQTVVNSAISYFQSLQAKPFLVTAMGSHGGATLEGQSRLLASYGISEAELGVEVRAGMETDIIGHTALGNLPVHFDKIANQADHVWLISRIKPHTRFDALIESGLHKMLMIGLGNHIGASLYHRAFSDYSYIELVQQAVPLVLKNCPILGGIALVENERGETALIEALPANQFESREPDLLTRAKEMVPRLPFEKIDLLIIDEIGKDISGAGLDTNVVGRKGEKNTASTGSEMFCKNIFVRGLTPASYGNATGLGLVEFTNQRTIEQVDINVSRINVLTASAPRGFKLPIAYNTDREVVEQAFGCIGLAEPPDARVIQIQNTLKIEELLVSKAFLQEIEGRADLEICSEPMPMLFDAAGNLKDVI